MSWDKILFLIGAVIVGLYINGKLYDNYKNKDHNDSWKNRNK